jgi:hypothetical protein
MKIFIIMMIAVMLAGCAGLQKVVCYGDQEHCVKSWLDAAIYPTTQAMSK